MLAILVPYRDRAAHLAEFIPAIHAHLHAIPHRIYVIEQMDDKPFNRGKLFNAGFSMLPPVHDTVVLHDVDLIPMQSNYGNIAHPTHLSAHCTQFEHGTPHLCFGGVVAIPCDQFRRINGFNNDYWGWGAEDDDLRERCGHAGLQIEWRQGRYRSLPHIKACNTRGFQDTYNKNLDRLRANQSGRCREYDTNGLNTLRFTVEKVFGTPIPGGHADFITYQITL